MKRLPRWQERRKALLQSACTFVAEMRQQAIPIGRAIKIAAEKFDRSSLGEGRRLNLSAKTLTRLWYAWKRKKDPSVFELKQKPRSLASDPLLLRMVVEYCFQNGSTLEEAIEAIRPPGTKLTIKHVFRFFPKRSLDSLASSQKRLLRDRARLEGKFLSSDAQFRRELLKQRADFSRRLLDEDAKLRRRLLNQRELLQRKFLRADAAAVKKRAALQQRFFKIEGFSNE